VLDLVDLGRLEEGLAALVAHPRGQGVPADVVAVAVDAEGRSAFVHRALAAKTVHVRVLRVKSGDY
jgi:hypothetical protein